MNAMTRYQRLTLWIVSLASAAGLLFLEKHHSNKREPLFPGVTHGTGHI